MTRRTAAFAAAGAAAIFGAAPGPAHAHVAAAPAHSSARRSPRDPGTVLVAFRASTSAAEARAVLERAGAGSGRPIPHTRFEVVRASATTPGALVARLRRDPRVAAAGFDYVRHATAVPNDPLFAGKSAHQQYLTDIRLAQAWDIDKGSAGVKIAVVDTGVDAQQSDLAGRVLTGYNALAGSSDASDENGHGTFVAGVAAAGTNNGIGIAGVAWNASILPVKVLNSSGNGTDADIAAGITWAADHGASVINLSLGGPQPSDVLKNAIDYAFSKNVVVVAAAGNDGDDLPQYPAAYPGVVAVSATTWSGNLTAFSSFGPWVSLAAPGWDVAGPMSGGYGSESGTSFAAPIVSGVAALVRDHFPAWTQQQVVADLRQSARDLGAPGFDDEFGYGMVDAYAALGGGHAARPAIGGDALEPNDVPDRATLLPGDGSYSATIAPEGDVDWYARQASGGPSEITWEVSPPPTDIGGPADSAQWMDVAVEAFGPDMKFLGRVDLLPSSEKPVQISVPVEQRGMYYLKVWSRTGSQSVGLASPRPSIDSYTVSVSSGTPDGTDPPVYMPEDQYYLGDSYLTASAPSSVAVGDVTGDGRTDIVMTTGSYFSPQWDDSLVLYRQRPDGWLAEPVKLPLLDDLQRPDQVVVGDVNGDGRSDVVLAGSEGIDVYLQGSSGTLGPPSRIPGTGPAYYVAAADMDGDHRADVVALVGQPGTTTMSLVVLHSTASGFTTQTLDTMARGCVGGCSTLAVGDLNGDGRPDIVENGTVYPSGGGYVEVLRTWLQGVGGTFASTDTAVTSNPGPMEIGDLNGDGRFDLVVQVDSELQIFPGTPTGLGTPSTVPSTLDSPGYIVTDANGDGRADLVLSEPQLEGPSDIPNLIDVRLQTSSGTLSKYVDRAYLEKGNFGAGSGVASGDINGDGLLDIVSLGGPGGGLRLLRHYSSTWPLQPLWIRSTTPADNTQGASTTAPIVVRFGRQITASSVTSSTVQLADGATGAAVPAAVAYDATTGNATITPASALGANRAYVVVVSGVVDSTGNTMARVYTAHFLTGAVTDTTPPDTFITSPWPSYAYNWSPLFTLDASEPVQRYDCSIDGGAWTPCSSPVWFNAWSNDGPGTHSFAVRAVDDAGNVDPTPARATWTVISTTSQPANDSFASGTVVSGSSGSVSGTNELATAEAGEPAHAGNNGGASVWFSWTAPASGTVAFDTAGSAFDTLLAVYTGSDVGSLTAVASNDDVSATDSTSRVTFSAFAGTTYAIAVDGYNAFGRNSSDPNSNPAAEGPFALHWSQGAATGPPTTIASGPSGTVTSTTASFAFSASVTGSTFECSLDSGGWSACTSPTTYSSLAAGSHVFRVFATDAAGNVGPTASRAWTVATSAPPANDNFASAQTIAGASGSVSGDNTNAARESGEPTIAGNSGGHSVWFSWTAPSNGTLTLTTAGSAFDTLLAAYTGSSLTVLTQLAANDDVSPSDHTSKVTFSALAGTVYRIAVDGFHHSTGGYEVGAYTLNWTLAASGTAPPDTSIDSGPSGTVTDTSATFAFSSPSAGVTFQCELDGAAFASCTSPKSYAALASGTHTFQVRAVDSAGNVDPTPAGRTWTIQAVSGAPANDDFASAQALTATGSGSNANATKQAGEPNHAGNDGGHSVWFTWQAPTAGSTTIDTEGSGFDTLLAVYTGTSVSTLTQVAANDDVSSSDHTSKVTFTATAGTTYRIALDGFHHFNGVYESGAYTITLTPPAGSPPSPSAPDTSIDSGPSGTVTDTGATFAFSSSTTGATFQCALDGAAFAACTSPKSYTALAVGAHTFQVRAVAPGGTVDPTPAGRTWTIQASTPPPSGAPANDDFGNAQALSGQSGNASGSNANATKQAGEPNHAGNDGGHSVWFSWQAPATGTATIDTAGSAFDTLLAVYTGSTLTGLTKVAASDDVSSSDHTSKVTFQAAAGTIYQIAVDGFHHSTGAYETGSYVLNFALAGAGPPPPDATPPDTAIDSGPNGTVSDTSATFAFSSSESASTFQCELDGAAFAVCASPVTYTGLAVGTHTFEVRAIDAAGNVDATPAGRTWTIQPGSPPPPPANLLANGGFDADTSGWVGWQATLSDTNGAALVSANAGAGAYSLYPSPRPVTSTTAGTTYTAGGSARTDGAAGSVCLYIREWSSGGNVVAQASKCVTATSAWQQFPTVTYTTQQSGGSLEVYVMATGGTSFETDGLTLSAG